MIIITSKGQFDTEKDLVVLQFKDDTDLNDFLTKIATIPVKTSGMRVVTLLPKKMEINSFQEKILSVIDNFDGIDSNNKEEDVKRLDDSIKTLQNLIN